MFLFSPRPIIIAIALSIALVGTPVAMAAPQAADTFVVTTPVDNGSNTTPTVGSLRWAIKQANANANLSTINFALSGCPTVLNLSGIVLPDVTSDVTINGYSQTGSITNAHFGKFDATLCVILNGGNNAATGLHTSGNGRLSVSGLGFAGFTDAAIRLDSGSVNYVTGNQIGAIAFLTQNADGVRFSGTAADSIVGGSGDPSMVNLIIGNTGSGVYIDSTNGGNFVDHDLIGMNGDGASGNGNNIGVNIYNSPGNDVLSCYISYNTAQGVLIAGPSTIGTTLQDNQIGLTFNGSHAANGTQGVQITFGASNSTIGAVQNAVTNGNAIYADGAAVWLTSTAGVQNRILANVEMYSGVLGLPIDLGSAGPTANDAKDLDSGANDLQNYPVVLNVFRTTHSDGTIAAEWVEGILDGAPNDAFRLDFYWGPCCSSVRGNATYYSGRGDSDVTDANGHAHFWVKLAGYVYPSVGEIGATATASNGDTSEMGVGVMETVGDMIFRDDLELH